MADTGKLASFKFNGTLYDADDCLQSWNLADSINEVVYQCNSYDKGAAGTRSVVFSGSMALAKTDTTKVGAIYPGATGAFEAHPAGDTGTYIEITSTSALVTRADKSSGPNAIITLDFSIRLNDVTIGAAAT